MLSEAWGLVQVGSGLCSETGPGPKTDERILFFFFEYFKLRIFCVRNFRSNLQMRTLKLKE